MSLLLKALKHAETAHAEKHAPPEPDLALEAIETGPAHAREWLEPPSMLFGNSGFTPAPAKARRVRMPQLSLVPATALLAGVVALGYGVYLYWALQPAATPITHAVKPEVNPVARSTVLAPAAISPVAQPFVANPPPAPATPESITSPAAATALSAPDTPKPSRRQARTIHAQASQSTTGARETAPASPRGEAKAQPAVTPYALQPDSGNTLINQAYDAYQRGQLTDAQRLYTQAAARQRSVDALLGLAAVAAAQNRSDDAARLYREVMERDPHNAAAQSALLDILGNTDRHATESRLKALIERSPSAGLYQTLGNLYAEQNRWGDAQIAYFEAFRAAPHNADYAFNLAASLDRLHQPQAALGYYEKALNLGGNPRFDRTQAELRIRQIKAIQP